MKIGDLVRLATPPGNFEEDIGVITHVWDDEFIDVLFSDGEHCVALNDYEVISE